MYEDWESDLYAGLVTLFESPDPCVPTSGPAFSGDVAGDGASRDDDDMFEPDDDEPLIDSDGDEVPDLIEDEVASNGSMPGLVDVDSDSDDDDPVGLGADDDGVPAIVHRAPNCQKPLPGPHTDLPPDRRDAAQGLRFS